MNRSKKQIADVDDREFVGMIQADGMTRIRVMASTKLMSHNIPAGEDHRDLHLDMLRSGSKMRTTRLTREEAEALICLLRAGIATL